MDHKNLEYFHTVKKLNRQQAQWSLYLSQFDFMLHHHLGCSMGKSDMLLRRPDHGSGSQDNTNLVLLNTDLFMVRALESVFVEGEEKEVLSDIHTKVKSGVMEDSVAKMVKGLKDSKAHMVMGAEWNLCDGLVYYCDSRCGNKYLCIATSGATSMSTTPAPMSSIALGVLQPSSCGVPPLSSSLILHPLVHKSDLCLCMKKDWHAPMGELQPLEIPEHPWQIVSVDFITELPEAHGYDVVMVAVDTLGKCVHFIPTHTTVTASGLACIYLHQVWKLHG
jgi:hypothetical protein